MKISTGLHPPPPAPPPPFSLLLCWMGEAGSQGAGAAQSWKRCRATSCDATAVADQQHQFRNMVAGCG